MTSLRTAFFVAAAAPIVASALALMLPVRANGDRGWSLRLR